MKKRIILFVIIALGVPLGLLLLSSLLRQKKPIPSVSPTPTSRPILVRPSPTQIVDNTALFVTNITPPENPKEPYLPIQQVTFTFNEEVDPQSVSYEITPPIPVVLRNGASKREIIISAKTSWTAEVATITLLQGTTSLTRKSLATPVAYVLKTGFPRTAPPDAEGI